MSTKTETENIKTSGAEKVLAAILTLFILIGGVWAYGQIGKISEERYTDDYGGRTYYPATDSLSAKDRQALKSRSRARSDVYRAESAVRRTTAKLEFVRETYRTEIEADRTAPVELAAYRVAQAALAQAQERLAKARDDQKAAAPAAVVAKRNLRLANQEKDDQQESDDRIVFGLRLLLVLAMLAGGYAGLSAVRRRRSRLLPLALAEISAAALLGAFMAIDYGSSFIVFREVGPLAISIVGIVLTVAAFIALQRYLAKRVPIRRVRKQECPFCGYPAHGNPQCEGCGRKVVAECTTCHQPRRVATPHCGQCGAA